MSGSQESWSSNPNAPNIPYSLYSQEKANFAGTLIGSILYGIVIVLFFQCMAALFNPLHRRGEGIKWGLVSYTAVTFSSVTVATAMNLGILSVSYIENREFPGGGAAAPGPFGYQLDMDPKALIIVPDLFFIFNDLLANILLLYRCYLVYSMNLCVIAFPCLMFLGSLAMGIMFLYQLSELTGGVYLSVWFDLPYFSISLSLNVLLTLMIVIRLILHTRDIRASMGGTGTRGLYKVIVTMLIESSALYAVSSLLVLGPSSAENSTADIFMPILVETQAIAPLLIIRRVANKSALTKDTIASGRITSLKFAIRGKSTDDNGSLPTIAVDGYGMNSGEFGVGVGSTIHQGKV